MSNDTKLTMLVNARIKLEVLLAIAITDNDCEAEGNLREMIATINQWIKNLDI